MVNLNVNDNSNQPKISDLEKYNGKMTCDTAHAGLIFNSSSSIPILEQENHINVDRHSNKTLVCCSHKTWITKLRKHPQFKVTKIVYNCDYKILEMVGEFPTDVLTLRRIRNA